MAQTESQSKGMQTPTLPHLTPAELAAMGEKRLEDFAKAQAVLFGTLHETHQRWLDRMQSEARLASEFTRKVANARSIPDTMAACREWASRRFEMMADDGNHLLADSQKVIETGARFLSFVDEPGAGSEPGRDNSAGDRQRLKAFNPDEPGRTGSATTPGQRAATRSDVREESRSGSNAASL
jgi:hypothetical protein